MSTATRRLTIPLLFPPVVLAATSPTLVARAPSRSPTVDTHPRGTPYVTTSGTGNRTIPSVALPDRWSPVWTFSCTDPTSRRPFGEAVSIGGGPSHSVTDRTGLEGGGYRPFAMGGPTMFAGPIGHPSCRPRPPGHGDSSPSTRPGGYGDVDLGQLET